MITCPKCGSHNADNSTYCSNCGFKFPSAAYHSDFVDRLLSQDQPSVQRVKWAPILAVCGIVIVIFLLAISIHSRNSVTSNSNTASSYKSVSGIDSGLNANTDITSSTSVPSISSGTSAASSTASNSGSFGIDHIFNIGDIITYKDLTLSVTQVHRSNGNEFDYPKSGMEFVIVTVSIYNDGNQNISYNPYYFKMQNSQGQVENVTFETIDSNTVLEAGELVPGGTVTGTVTFEEPQNDTGLILQYEYSMFDKVPLRFHVS